MILLDTHIWVWWVQKDSRLSNRQIEIIFKNEKGGLGVSVFSIWEVAKLIERKKIMFKKPIEEWIDIALRYPGITLIDLNPQIAIESTRLPGNFHRDPADQIIVATSRLLDIPILTSDKKIFNYPHVKLVQ
ncbi:MAG: type II toxin-antitoxin system VapC family toxin [Ignavibacteriae bacterium]|nr:type II toxin-antitoxin system VapC family toxin [Ignavibacteriota bacterium]